MRALPLTNKARPGGRPRATRAPRNAFADWLATCGMTPEQLAVTLKVSVSSVYNARNGYFRPGRDLAVRIAELSTPAATPDNPDPRPAVPVESWSASRARTRRGKKAA